MVRDPSSQPKFGYWKHRKRDEIVAILHFGHIEATLVPCVIYQDVRSSLVWVRPCDEFFDGRFERQS